MSDGIVYGLNDAAAAWWSWMAPMAWQVALLVAVVWAIDRIARRWVWPQVLHALWLLVPLKLVLPPSLASPVSLVGRLIPARAVESVATIAPAPAPMPDFPAMMPPIDASAMPVPPPEFTWHVALAALWVAGMIALIGLLIVRLRAFSRILRSTATVPASAEIVEAAHRAAARLGLRRVPRIVRTPAVESPAAFGPFRPVILLPADEQYAPEEIDGILLHELAHAKRADLLAHAMLTAFMFAYWFNPALWLAGRRIRALRELSCDATVAAVLRDETPTYRKTLLAAARRMLRRHEALSIGLLGITEDTSMMTQRLRWLDRRPWRYRRLRRVSTVITEIALAMILVPMSSADEDAATRADIPREVIGSWEGRSRIYVTWSERESVAVALRVYPDGRVTGKIGDATLRDGQFKRNRGAIRRRLGWATDWIIAADLDGPVYIGNDVTISYPWARVPLDDITDREMRGFINASGRLFKKESHAFEHTRLTLRRITSPRSVGR